MIKANLLYERQDYLIYPFLWAYCTDDINVIMITLCNI